MTKFGVESDILLELNKDEMVELKEIYSKTNDVCYVYTLIDVAIRCHEKSDLTRIIKITSPNNTWRQDGSIVIFYDLALTSVFAYSLDKTYCHVREGLLNTKRIDPKGLCFFYNIHENDLKIMIDIIGELNRKVKKSNKNNLYVLNKDKAKAFDISCPGNTVIKKLNVKHAKQIDNVWPHKYENSVKATEKVIERIGGFGLFEKNDELMAWVLQGPLGHINLLQVEEKYKRKGYGELMAKFMAKHIAESGNVPAATVLVDNVISCNLFEKLGFEVIGNTYFILTEVS